jgi:aspartokinase-like uncharacterized kinase
MENEASSLSLQVVKVSGSLYEQEDLGARLGRWLAEVRSSAVGLVPGGGNLVDVVRDLDRRHGLGEETSHWLALQALTLNAYFLAELLRKVDSGRRPIITGEATGWRDSWRAGNMPILDAEAFARADEHRVGRLPHCWDVTSDSVAARVAVVGQASRLILLKSVTLPEGLDWTEAGRRGFVDPLFARVVSTGVRAGLEVQVLNFREWRAGPAPSTSRPGRGSD